MEAVLWEITAINYFISNLLSIKAEYDTYQNTIRVM